MKLGTNKTANLATTVSNLIFYVPTKGQFAHFAFVGLWLSLQDNDGNIILAAKHGRTSILITAQICEDDTHDVAKTTHTGNLILKKQVLDVFPGKATLLAHRRYRGDIVSLYQDRSNSHVDGSPGHQPAGPRHLQGRY